MADTFRITYNLESQITSLQPGNLRTYVCTYVGLNQEQGRLDIALLISSSHLQPNSLMLSGPFATLWNKLLVDTCSRNWSISPMLTSISRYIVPLDFS